MCLPALLKMLWVCPALSSGQGCCCCSVKRRDAPRNVGSPENLAAVTGVFRSQSVRPSLFVRRFVVPGLGSSAPEHTLYEASPLTQICLSVDYMTMTPGDVLHHVLLGFLNGEIFAQMYDPFVLVLRQQQQQQLTQVSAIMSRTTKMKVRRTKKAPSSTGVALGRPCSLTHILFSMFSVSSLASIL